MKMETIKLKENFTFPEYCHITLFAVEENPSAIPADKRKKRAEFSINNRCGFGILIEILEGYQPWSGFKMTYQDEPHKNHFQTDYSPEAIKKL